MKIIRSLTKVLLTLTGIGGLQAPAFADASYPSKPITIMVSYQPGGESDMIARTLADKLASRLKQPVVVENKVGASGIIGSNFVSRALPDGYTLLLAPSTFPIAQLVLKTTPSAGYDPVKGFTPIIKVSTTPLFLIAGSHSGTRTWADVLAQSKQGKGLQYGSPGSGSPMHILGEIVNREANVQMQHIPYKGTVPAITDIIGGHLGFTYTTLGAAMPYLSTGKLTILANASDQRSELAREVPTFQELGYKNVDVAAWYGIFGPKGLPANIVKILNENLNEILKMQDVAAKFSTFGTTPAGGVPAELEQTNSSDVQRFGKIISELGIQSN